MVCCQNILCDEDGEAESHTPLKQKCSRVKQHQKGALQVETVQCECDFDSLGNATSAIDGIALRTLQPGLREFCAKAILRLLCAFGGHGWRSPLPCMYRQIQQSEAVASAYGWPVVLCGNGSF